jgi:PAS domain S-box-containing protein
MIAAALGSAYAYRVGADPATDHVQILSAIVLSALELVLIVALVAQNRRRRRLEASLNRQVRFETTLADLLRGFARVPSSQAGTAVDASLREVARAVGVDDVWLGTFGDMSNPNWIALRLRSEERLVITQVDDLPRALGPRVADRPPGSWSIAVTALDAGGVTLGALFWISLKSRTTWSAELLDQLRMISEVFADNLQRQRASDALAVSDALKGAILRSLPSSVAVLDRHGVILTVNESLACLWSTSAHAPGVIASGVDYLAICASAASAGVDGAREALDGVAAVCAGSRPRFELEYRCDLAGDERWFLMTVTPLRIEDGGAVVSHTDITERKRADITVRESEGRFRRLADALPVGVWMCGGDTACIYVNKTWCDMTGRSLQASLGSGWLEDVHPDDRHICKEACTRAFETQNAVSVEYRVRRHDGEYRWVLDHGVPRYDEDGKFLGFIGGVTDLTDYRRAEQMLRDLSGRLIGAQEEERLRIARELHDNVGQRLALVAMEIDQLAAVVRGSSAIEASFASLRATYQEVSSEVHYLSHRLHSAKLDALGLVPAVQGHCHEVSDHGVRVRFSDDHVPNTLSGATSLCLFRVVQEALANVVKHSGASEARVSLSTADSQVVLRVEDSGRGFEPDTRNDGLGLVSMRERVRSVGGEMVVRSTPNHGTTIEARVPIHVPSRQADQSQSAA